jgi:hypothetical protein
MFSKLHITIAVLLILLVIIIVAFSIEMTRHYCHKNYKKQFDCYEQNTRFNPNLAVSKCVCIYAYYEKNITYIKNFQFFLHNGILPNVDYYFVINGECSFSIDDFLKDKDVNYSIVKRKNTGYDFGAWSSVVNSLKGQYAYYIFINTSVRGPINDPGNTTNNKNWLNTYLQLFNTKDVRLVGVSINVYMGTHFKYNIKKILNCDIPYTHVQSMFFILDYKGLQFLKQKQFFNEQFDEFHKVVIHKEIGMSQLLLNNGWNINCFQQSHKNYDYRKITNNLLKLFFTTNKEKNTIFTKHKSDNDKLRIVIARYNEDITWAQQLKEAIIYDKNDTSNIGNIDDKNDTSNIGNIDNLSGVKGMVIPLPNVGRGGHTYYKYIYDNYEDLSDYTMFLQGHPFDHYPNINNHFFEDIRQKIKKNKLKNFTPLGNILHCKISHCKYHPEPLPMKQIYKKVFNKNAFPYMKFKFVQGAQFIVSKKQILKRPKAFYLNIVKLLEKEINPIEGFIIERFHKLILCK